MKRNALKYNSRFFLLLEHKLGGTAPLLRFLAEYGINPADSTYRRWKTVDIDRVVFTDVCHKLNVNMYILLDPAYSSLPADIILDQNNGSYDEQFIDVRAIVIDYIIGNNFIKERAAKLLHIDSESINDILTGNEEKYPKIMMSEIVRWINESPMDHDYIRLSKDDCIYKYRINVNTEQPETINVAEDLTEKVQQKISATVRDIKDICRQMESRTSDREQNLEAVFQLEKCLSDLKYLVSQQ